MASSSFSGIVGLSSSSLFIAPNRLVSLTSSQFVSDNQFQNNSKLRSLNCTQQCNKVLTRGETPPQSEYESEFKNADLAGTSVRRREALKQLSLFPILASGAPFWFYSNPAEAREKRTKLDIAEELYQETESGAKYYDAVDGKGEAVKDGDNVSVHFSVIYRGLTIASSRESKLLGGNRTISQPYEFTIGAKPGSERKRDAVESANGLFSAQAAPKPPLALYSLATGMRVGGKRLVIAPPELAYGSKGYAEVPPDASVQLVIELLEIVPTKK